MLSLKDKEQFQKEMFVKQRREKGKRLLKSKTFTLQQKMNAAISCLGLILVQEIARNLVRTLKSLFSLVVEPCKSQPTHRLRPFRFAQYQRVSGGEWDKMQHPRITDSLRILTDLESQPWRGKIMTQCQQDHPKEHQPFPQIKTPQVGVISFFKKTLFLVNILNNTFHYDISSVHTNMVCSS